LFVIGNLGLTALKEFPLEKILRFVDKLQFDAISFHVNPLHEAFQEHGDTDFSGLISLFVEARKKFFVPVGIKTVGFGAGKSFALKIKSLNPDFVEISGAGGTSFVKVEFHRNELSWLKRAAEPFFDYGIPLERSLGYLRKTCPKIPIIASGGIRNGVDIFKVIALGADMAAAAIPFVKEPENSEQIIKAFNYSLKVAMFVAGVKKVEHLNRGNLLMQRGFNEIIEN
jgi:isopentenyl-diphosphate delta-isomerase